MSRRRQSILPKTPILLACEGQSEMGYGQMLQALLSERGRPIHLDVVPLAPGAGDPLARIQKTVALIRRRELHREPYRSRFVLMDADQVAMAQDRAARAERLAGEAGIEIVWQSPCHEALLLRHFSGMESRRPPTVLDAERALSRVWPDYLKPMSRAALGARISQSDIKRAATVEPGLALLLSRIGLLP